MCSIIKGEDFNEKNTYEESEIELSENSDSSFFIKTKEGVLDLRKNIVLVDGKDRIVSTAFFMRKNDKTFLFVMLKRNTIFFPEKITDLDGNSIELKKGFFESEKCGYLMPIKSRKYAYLDVVNSPSLLVELGDSVLIPVHDGYGSIDLKKTYISRVSKNLISISYDGKFSLSDVGAPVIHEKTGLCIGVLGCMDRKLQFYENMWDVNNAYDSIVFHGMDNFSSWILFDKKDLAEIFFKIKEMYFFSYYVEKKLLPFFKNYNKSSIIPADYLNDVEGLEGLKKIVFNFNSAVKEPKTKRKTNIYRVYGVNGIRRKGMIPEDAYSTVWETEETVSKNSSLLRETKKKEFIEEILKIFSFYETYCERLKSKKILEDKVHFLLENITRQKNDFNSILKNISK